MDIKSNFKYDVLIVGAGPIGIYVSIQLAKSGFDVLVVEEDEQVGKPRFCTGLISKDAFDKFSLPKSAIENKFNSAWFFSPLGAKVYFKNKSIEIYATDRSAFDHGLYLQAEKAGVKFLLKCRCLGLKIDSDYVSANVFFDGKEAVVKSGVVVLATGIKYNLHRNVGLASPPNFLDCSQVQVSGNGDGEIEIFLGSSIAPHSFAWIVPLKEKKMRIGLSTHKNSIVFLKSFLKNLKLKGRVNEENYNITRRPVPLGSIGRTYTNRILAVGDAAGQVKPTTGGGIYFGLMCADLAALTIINAFRKNDFSSSFLRHYEINWKKKIEFDLTMGLYLRKLLNNFSDEQIEKLLQFFLQQPTRELIEKHVDFNHHGKLIKELIKNPVFWKSLYEIIVC